MKASPEPIRVLLVEDNDVFRQALELLLELQEGLEVVGAVSDGSKAVDACRELQPHVDCLRKDQELEEIVAAVRAAGESRR